MVFGKQGKTELNLPMILLAAIVLMMVPGVPEYVSNFLGLSSPGSLGSVGTGTGGAGTSCVDPTVKVTATIDSENAFAPATTPGGDNYLWVSGTPVGRVPNGGTETLSPGQPYKVLFVENSTTYYGKVVEGVVPCSGTLRLHEKLYQMSVDALTSAIRNENGDNNAGNNVTLAAGDIVNIPVTITGYYKKAIGNPNTQHGNVLTCATNATSYDDVVINDGRFIKTDKPDIVTSAAGKKYRSWYMPALVSNEEISFTVLLDASDTIAPSDDSSDVFCRIDDIDYDLNAVTNELLQGPEDEQNNNLGAAGALFNFTIQVT